MGIALFFAGIVCLMIGAYCEADRSWSILICGGYAYGCFDGGAYDYIKAHFPEKCRDSDI